MDDRTAIKQALRASRRRSFANVKPRPDDRDDSATVQIADLIAGEIAENRCVSGRYLLQLPAARIHLSER
ncbi:MAG: hypothetical protein C4346_07725 [Chloroflexota bacterium]